MLIVRSAVLTPFASNCFLVGDRESREAILVDPGEWSEEVAALAAPEGFRVTRVICTHGHIDHVSGVAEAKRTLGAPLWLHAADGAQLARLRQMAEMFGFGASEPPAVDHMPVDGETFQLGEQEGRVIHTPGHSPGGICVYFARAKALFTGDTLFVGSVGRTDLPGGSFEAIRGSIQQKLFTLGDDVRFFPGHGPSGLIGEERKTNPFVGENARR
jgi:glyoxylase-like metal-dependent hydrolase (beta-lactamase superfamily II)